jgi:hypothetical protein
MRNETFLTKISHSKIETAVSKASIKTDFEHTGSKKTETIESKSIEITGSKQSSDFENL